MRIRRSTILRCHRKVWSVRRDLSTGDLVAITHDDAQFEVEEFQDTENDVIVKGEHSLYTPEQTTGWDVNQG